MEAGEQCRVSSWRRLEMVSKTTRRVRLGYPGPGASCQ